MEKDSLKEDLKIFPLQDNTLLRAQLEKATTILNLRKKRPVEQTPGPGEYELKEEGGKGVTIGERLKERKPEDLPAPGQYEIKSRIIEGPQYSVGEKRYTKIEQTQAQENMNTR
ncbi:MAG: hypothetical protein IPK55_10960 [Streptococcus sp.]|nr:hypothetical protein [Streptococcus sp.]